MSFINFKSLEVSIFTKNKDLQERICKILAYYYENLKVTSYEDENTFFNSIKNSLCHIIIFDLSSYAKKEATEKYCKRLIKEKRGLFNIIIGAEKDLSLAMYCYKAGVRSLLYPNFSKKELDNTISLAINHYKQWDRIFDQLEVNNSFEGELNCLFYKDEDE